MGIRSRATQVVYPFELMQVDSNDRKPVDTVVRVIFELSITADTCVHSVHFCILRVNGNYRHAHFTTTTQLFE